MGSQGSVPRTDAQFSSFFVIKSARLCRLLECKSDRVVCVMSDAPFPKFVDVDSRTRRARGAYVAGLQLEVDDDTDADIEFSKVYEDDDENGWQQDAEFGMTSRVGFLCLVGMLELRAQGGRRLCLYEIARNLSEAERSAIPVERGRKPFSDVVTLQRFRLAPDHLLRTTDVNGYTRHGTLVNVRNGAMTTTVEVRPGDGCRLVDADRGEGRWLAVAFISGRGDKGTATCDLLTSLVHAAVFVARPSMPRDRRAAFHHRGVYKGYVLFHPVRNDPRVVYSDFE